MAKKRRNKKDISGDDLIKYGAIGLGIGIILLIIGKANGWL